MKKSINLKSNTLCICVLILVLLCLLLYRNGRENFVPEVQMTTPEKGAFGTDGVVAETVDWSESEARAAEELRRQEIEWARRRAVECGFNAKKRIYNLAITGPMSRYPDREDGYHNYRLLHNKFPGGLKAFLKDIKEHNEKIKPYIGIRWGYPLGNIRVEMNGRIVSRNWIYTSGRRIQSLYKIVKEIINKTLPFFDVRSCGNLGSEFPPPPPFLTQLTDEEKKILREGPENYTVIYEEGVGVVGQTELRHSRDARYRLALASTLGPEHQWKSLI